MNYQQFVVVIKEKVELLLSEDTTLHIHTTLKNNDRPRTGLTISDKHINIFPTIYLEEYYQQFLGGCSTDSIAESIVEVYHEVNFDHAWQIELIKDWGAIQSKIVYKLIHAKKNRARLQTMPHIPYLDLAIVFYVLFDVAETGIATIPINNGLLDLWEADLDALYKMAHENTKQLLPAQFRPMHVVVEELLGKPWKGVPEEDIMFVLSNPFRNFGAACMLYDNMLLQIGEQLGESFFILPSSIHEVIIVPESQSPTGKDLNDMIFEINQTQVDAEEILSDRAYYYDYQKQCLS